MILIIIRLLSIFQNLFGAGKFKLRASEYLTTILVIQIRFLTTHTDRCSETLDTGDIER